MDPKLIEQIVDGPVVLQSVDHEKRIVEFIISSETVIEGRGYRVIQDWNLEQFKKNPVFLWMHDAYGFTISGGMPVGKVLVDSLRSLTISSTNEGKVKATAVSVQFPTEQEFPLGHQIFKLYAAGYLNAVSVSFRPYDIKNPTKDGEVAEYRKNKLYELSGVAIGADDEAFITKRAQLLNKDPAEARQMFSELVVMQSKLPGLHQSAAGEGGELQGEFLDCGEHSVLVRCTDDVAFQALKTEVEKRSGWFDANHTAMKQSNAVMVEFFKQRGETQPDDLEQAYVRMGELLEQAPHTSDQPVVQTKAPENPQPQTQAKPVGVVLSDTAMRAGLADVEAQVTAAALEASRQGMSNERVKILTEQLYKQLSGEFFARFRSPSPQ